MSKPFKLISLGLNPFKPVDCENQNSIVGRHIAFPERPMIVNLGDKSGQLHVKNNKNKVTQSHNLAPGAYCIFTESIKGINANNLNIFEWHLNGQCIQKFIDQRNGYLIKE